MQNQDHTPSSREKDVKRLLSEAELRDIRRRENREGSPYSDRDMLLDHIELLVHQLPPDR
jgi:hypothetical protein